MRGHKKAGAHFNTKKVRLKHVTPQRGHFDASAFQYQKGAIKTFSLSFIIALPSSYFNTKKVRLKLFPEFETEFLKFISIPKRCD